MTDELTRAESGAISTRDGENEQRTVELRIVPYQTVAQTADGPEVFAKGAFRGVDASRVTIEAGRHGGPLVGRGLALEERDDAAYLTARIAPTAAGDELLTLTREGVYQDVSVVFVPRTSKRRADGVTERHSVDLRRVAILERGAYPGAQVVAVRGEPDDSEVEDVGETVDLTPVLDRLERMEQRADALALAAATPAAPELPAVLKFRSLGEFLKTAAEDQGVSRELARVIADQITDDNPGLTPTGWLRAIVNVINYGRPAITAFGTAALPPSGMSINWPVWTGYPGDPANADRLVNEQGSQKTEIESGLVSFTTGSADIRTFAGAADIAYQLIRRSDPSYLDAWGRVMAKSWAEVTDRAFIDSIWNTNSQYNDTAYDIDADTNGDVLLEALFTASVNIETVTGTPAEFVLASTSAFTKLAGMSRIVPAYPGNMSMAAGNATANTLQVSVNGLRVIHARELSNVIAPNTDAFLVSNTVAARWHEAGPFTITAEDVYRLGQNVAVWSMGAPALYVEDGLVWIYNAGN